MTSVVLLWNLGGRKLDKDKQLLYVNKITDF